MKCARCFKGLPETERFRWVAEWPVGVVEFPHTHVFPHYTSEKSGKVYCVSCWVATKGEGYWTRQSGTARKSANPIAGAEGTCD